MSKYELIKSVRVRGKVSMSGPYWKPEYQQVDSIGTNDIRLSLHKSGRKEYYIEFQRVGNIEKGLGDYGFQMPIPSTFEASMRDGNFSTEEAFHDDLISKYILNSNRVSTLTKKSDFDNGYSRFVGKLGGFYDGIENVPEIPNFISYYVQKAIVLDDYNRGLEGATQANSEFYKIVQDPFVDSSTSTSSGAGASGGTGSSVSSSVPPIPSGYFKIWEDWGLVYKKWSDDRKKSQSEEKKVSNQNTTSPSQDKTGQIHDSSKSYIFDVTSIDILSSADFGTFSLVGQGLVEPESDFAFVEEEAFLDEEYQEAEFQGAPEEDLDVVSGVAFTQAELKRDENPPVKEATKEDQAAANVKFGGSDVKAVSGSVSTLKVEITGALSSVQNSKAILKQAMGNGVVREISDIVAPSGEKLLANNIVKSMNEFISDVLDPFSTWLKEKYPVLFKGWYITSACRGYIPSGGSLTSQHLKGQAIDSQILGATSTKPEKNIELCNAILEWYKLNPVGYGQILFETRDSSCWIHWSYVRGNKRLFFARFAQDSTKAAPANKTGAYVLPPLDKKSLAFS